MAELENTWYIYVEQLGQQEEMKCTGLQRKREILLFIKRYDAREEKLYYCGHSYFKCDLKLSKYVSVSPFCV